MKFYRLTNSIDYKVVGKYPPYSGGYYPVDASDPRLTLNIFHTRVNEQEVFAPVLKLVKKANLTDYMPGTATGIIISHKLRELVEETNPLHQQYIIQKFIVEGNEIGGYWLTNNYSFDYSVIDFDLTEISIMKTTWDEDYKTKVKVAAEFLQLIENTHVPQSLEIKRPYFRPDYPRHFFALRYVYGLFSFFCSEAFRTKAEQAGITGIRYMELDVQL